jgi:hypothetical protein
MARTRTIAALVVNSDDSTAADAGDEMPLPTLDERVNFYLQAVHGDRRFTNEQYSEARGLLLKAMADDIVARSSGRSLDDVPLPVGANHNGLTGFADAAFLGAKDLGAKDQLRGTANLREARPVVAREPYEIIKRRIPGFSLAGHFSGRMAALCAAAGVAAVAGYLVAGITARFAPNSVPHDAPWTAQVQPPAPSSDAPSGSNPRIVAEAERELASALNIAQLSPDEVAALVKRGQQLASEGRFRLARLVLERAAEAKSASAALVLAQTYDPLVDRTAVHPDAPPDVAMARAWYEKAKELGSTEAAQRITQLPAPAPAPATRTSPK